MSEITTKIIKTSTQKKGGSIRRSITSGICVVCLSSIDKISNVIMDQTNLPPVISNLITKYFEDNDQYIGYVLLHRRSRRCIHVSCIVCWENILNDALNNSKIFINCIHARCNQFVHVTGIDQSIIY
jgi:hypothetical protein